MKLLGLPVPPRGLETRLRAQVEDRLVLVTGASSGIGAASARRLAAAGAHVVLTARSGNRLREVRDDILAAGGRADFEPADLADPAAASWLAAAVLDRHGPVDVLVSNAGQSIRRSLELSYDRPHDFERMIAVNYLGPVRLALGLLPAMRERGRGQIVNVATVGVQVPTPRFAAYLASKAAFDTWLRCAAPEIATDGVAATSVYMPLVRTRMIGPTRLYRRAPALSADDAAALVCRAVADRPRSVSPWWAQLAQLTIDVARGPFEHALRLAYRASDDSRAAKRAVATERDPSAAPT